MALVALIVVAGCGKPKVEPVEVTPPPASMDKPGPAPAVVPPAAPAKPGAAVPLPESQPKATAATPAPTATAPVAPAAGDPWAQIAAARTGVRSYKGTMQQGAQKITQFFKMAGGKPVRVKISAGSNWAIVQFDKKKAYFYDPQTKVAMVSSTEEGPFAEMAKIDDLSMIRKEAKSVTSGNLDKMDCWIVEVAGKQPATFCIDKKQGLIRQIKSGDQAVKLKIEDLNAVADKEFELPKGTKVQDMSSMMQGAPGQGGMPMPPR